MSIGFFDSGVGGLSVLREALILLPNENYIYYGDSDNAPYGVRTKDDVKRLTFNAVRFLVEKGIKALVVACNAATSAAVADLRKEFSFPVIGMEPAVKPAVEKNRNAGRRVIVLSTALTLREEKFQNLVSRVDTDHIVDMIPAPRLVVFAEKHVFEGPEVESYLRELLTPEKIRSCGAVVLGCTHFPFFRRALYRVLPSGIDVIDGNRGTILHLIDVLKSENLLGDSAGKGHVRFYRSGVEIKDPATLELYNKLLQDR